MTFVAQITINGKTANGLSSRLRYLISARRIRRLADAERHELRRLIDLAEIGRQTSGRPEISGKKTGGDRHDH